MWGLACVKTLEFLRINRGTRTPPMLGCCASSPWCAWFAHTTSITLQI